MGRLRRDTSLEIWQYASNGRLQSSTTAASNLDMDVARGGIEFLKDQLVPAVWNERQQRRLGTLANLEQRQTPVARLQGSGAGGAASAR